MNSSGITTLVDSTVLRYNNASLKSDILKEKHFHVRLGISSPLAPSKIHFPIAQLRESMLRREQIWECLVDAKQPPFHALSLSPLITPSSTFPLLRHAVPLPSYYTSTRCQSCQTFQPLRLPSSASSFLSYPFTLLSRLPIYSDSHAEPVSQNLKPCGLSRGEVCISMFYDSCLNQDYDVQKSGSTANQVPP